MDIFDASMHALTGLGLWKPSGMSMNLLKHGQLQTKTLPGISSFRCVRQVDFVYRR